jgi:hypothetical protein
MDYEVDIGVCNIRIGMVFSLPSSPSKEKYLSLRVLCASVVKLMVPVYPGSVFKIALRIAIKRAHPGST